MMLSSEELRDRLKRAADAVEAAEVPSDLRGIAFEHSLKALGVGASTAGIGSGTEEVGPEFGQVTAPVHGTGALARIGSRLGLSEDAVSRVFEEDGGEIRLIVRRAMLPHPNSKAASMRDVALLVVTGRQAAGLEDSTSYDVIRTECQEIRVYDRPNFATELAKLEFRTTGGPRARHAKAHRHHYEDAADLIRRITQAEEQ